MALRPLALGGTSGAAVAAAIARWVFSGPIAGPPPLSVMSCDCSLDCYSVVDLVGALLARVPGDFLIGLIAGVLVSFSLLGLILGALQLRALRVRLEEEARPRRPASYRCLGLTDGTSLD